MKRRIRRIIVFVIIIAVVGAAGIFAYLLYQETSNRNPYTTIQSDAVFVFRTDNLSRGWKELSGTEFWKALKNTPKYESINKTANKLDSIIARNKTVYRLLENRPVMVSAHMTGTYDYGIKITVDLLKASKIVFLKDFALQILRLYGYDYVKMKYKGQEIIQVMDKEKAESFYMAFIDNIMVTSFQQSIIKETIDLEEKKSLARSNEFQKAKNNISSVGLLRFYFNFDRMKDFIRVYQDPSNYKSLIKTTKAAGYMALDLNAETKRLTLQGQTSYHDSIVSPYIKTLRDIKPKKAKAFSIVPRQTAVYLSFTFKDFANFHSRLVENYKTIDSASYKTYVKGREQINKILNVDIEEKLTSWIGQEIAFLKLQPGHKTNVKDAVVCIQADDVGQAHQSLDKLNEQIRKNLPAKFESHEYLGRQIYYLNISGFFRFLFSNLLSKIDKPYYTFLEDQVIFSNRIENLYRMIDAYVKGQTLASNDKYMDFASGINSRSPVNIYINTPSALEFLYSHANTRTRNQIKENKEVLASFSRIGIQIKPGNTTIETNLLLDYDQDALYQTALDKLENKATDLYSLKLQKKDFSPKIPENYTEHSTFITLYYADSIKTRAEGKLKRGKPDGTWRFYYPSGNIKAVVDYKKGKVENKAFFYYNHPSQPLLCEAQFDNNELEGPYREYYKNGNLKAKLTFDNNRADGAAVFYYTNEGVKIKGKYKKGNKKGNWTYYTPEGKEYDKKYMRKTNNVP